MRAGGFGLGPPWPQDPAARPMSILARGSFRPRVEFPEGLLESRSIGVGIELRGIDIGVSEEFLDDAEVCAMREEMRRAGVPQQVRVELFGDACHKAGEAAAEFARGLDIEKVMCKFN